MGGVFDAGIATWLDTAREMEEYVLARMGAVGWRRVALPKEPYLRLWRARRMKEVSDG